jgi:hypothetical protein
MKGKALFTYMMVGRAFTFATCVLVTNIWEKIIYFLHKEKKIVLGPTMLLEPLSIVRTILKNCGTSFLLSKPNHRLIYHRYVVLSARLAFCYFV